VLLTALGLLAVRWDALHAQGELDSIVSRESAFLLNNVLFVAATFTVFFGTVFPLLSEAARGVKVSVGAPFFNQVNVPLFLALIFLMGVGPLIAWRRASFDNLRRNFLWPVLVGVAAAAFFFSLGVRSAIAVLVLALTVSEESNHFKVAGAFTVSNGRGLGVLRPAKKFYPQETSPIAYVDYRLGLREDIYLVLGDFARDGSQATVKFQVNRLVSWIWI